MSSKPAPPPTLATPGAELWVSIVETYDLRADELRTLEDACCVTDMIAALSSVWEDIGRPVTSRGSQGQEVIHPLIGEIRTQRMARNTLWKQLKLPDDAGAPVNQQRDAANTKWSRRGA